MFAELAESCMSWHCEGQLAGLTQARRPVHTSAAGCPRVFQRVFGRAPTLQISLAATWSLAGQLGPAFELKEE